MATRTQLIKLINDYLLCVGLKYIQPKKSKTISSTIVMYTMSEYE